MSEKIIDSTSIMSQYAVYSDEKVDSKIPEGPVAEKWTNFKAHQKLVNPANKRHLDIIVVGTGLAGASAASTLGEMGFNGVELLYPGLSTPRALNRRAGWYQRSEKLSERW